MYTKNVKNEFKSGNFQKIETYKLKYKLTYENKRLFEIYLVFQLVVYYMRMLINKVVKYHYSINFTNFFL